MELDAWQWTLIGVVIGAVLGGLISWAVAFRHYKKAAEDLRDEARDIHRRVSAIATALESGHFKFHRDEHNNIDSIQITGEIHQSLPRFGKSELDS